jgi:hypothetical protein
MTTSNTASLSVERGVWCGIGQGADLRESYKLLGDRYRTDGQWGRTVLYGPPKDDGRYCGSFLILWHSDCNKGQDGQARLLWHPKACEVEITTRDTVERKSGQLPECAHGGPPTMDGANLTHLPPPKKVQRNVGLRIDWWHGFITAAEWTGLK